MTCAIQDSRCDWVVMLTTFTRCLCVCIHICTRMYEYMCHRVCARMCMYMCACTCMCMCMCACTCMCVCARARALKLDTSIHQVSWHELYNNYVSLSWIYICKLYIAYTRQRYLAYILYLYCKFPNLPIYFE